MSLTEEHRAYLLSRGYTPELLLEDQPFSVNGKVSRLGLTVEHQDGAVGWDVFSMAQSPMGILTRETKQKKYRWAQKKEVEHLPIMFGSKRDYELLWETKKAVISEGIFDRVALKRLWPTPTPIFARLTKGIGKQFLVFLSRYADEVITVFDNDDPGRTATERTENKLEGAKSLLLPAHDPAKFLETYGEAKGRALIRKRLLTLED